MLHFARQYGRTALKTKQKNLRLDEDVIKFIEDGAQSDHDRPHGKWLSMQIRAKLMPKVKKPDKPKKDLGEQIGVLPLANGDDHPIHQVEVDEWATIYPAVSVQQELNNMLGWLKASSSRKKTKAGINKFINGWLSRSQDKGGKNDRFQTSGGNGKEAVARQLSDPDYALENF